MLGFETNIDEILRDHVHGPCKVYPTLAAGVTATSNGSAWVLGDFVEVVPANTITKDFDIHYINIAAASGNDTYELVLYYGNSDIECGRVRISRNSTQYNPPLIPFMCDILPANSKIRAKVACSSGSFTLTLSLFYHTY